MDVEYDLLEILQDTTWQRLQLPLACMREVGPAVQTFAGFRKITNETTFVAIEKIAEASWLPVETCKKHLRKLQLHGWIENEGRKLLPGSKRRKRRTATRSITSKAKLAKEYAVLPLVATHTFPSVGLLSWADKAVFSIVCSRLLMVAGDEFVQNIEGIFLAEDRFELPLQKLQDMTGLSHQSVVKAKERLIRSRMVQKEQGSRGDILLPNPEFRFQITT